MRGYVYAYQAAELDSWSAAKCADFREKFSTEGTAEITVKATNDEGEETETVETKTVRLPTPSCPTVVVTLSPPTDGEADLGKFFASELYPAVDVFYLPWAKKNSLAGGVDMQFESLRIYIEGAMGGRPNNFGIASEEEVNAALLAAWEIN